MCYYTAVFSVVTQCPSPQLWKGIHDDEIPCSMKILREFFFADWRFFVVWGNKFLAVRDDWNFCWELIFVILCSRTRIFKWKKPQYGIFNFYFTVCWVNFHSAYIFMVNNSVITVISYCTKGLNNSKTKQKPILTIHNKFIKSRVFNLTEGS